MARSVTPGCIAGNGFPFRSAAMAGKADDPADCLRVLVRHRGGYVRPNQPPIISQVPTVTPESKARTGGNCRTTMMMMNP